MSVNNKKSKKCSILKQKSLLSVAMVFSLIFTSTELLTVQLTVKAQPLFSFSHVSRSQVLGDAGFVYPDWSWSYSIHSLKKNPGIYQSIHMYIPETILLWEIISIDINFRSGKCIYYRTDLVKNREEVMSNHFELFPM